MLQLLILVNLFKIYFMLHICQKIGIKNILRNLVKNVRKKFKLLKNYLSTKPQNNSIYVIFIYVLCVCGGNITMLYSLHAHNGTVPYSELGPGRCVI